MFFKILLVPFMFLGSTLYGSEKPTLIIGENEQRVISLPGLKKFSVGGSAIRAITLPHSLKSSHPSILIKGIRPGFSDLWIWLQDGSSQKRTVEVIRWKSRTLHDQLRRSMSTLTETEIIVSGKAFLLRGEIHSFAEAQRIHDLISLNPKKIQNMTFPSHSLLIKAKKQIEKWLKSSSLSLSVSISGNTLKIQGQVETKAEKERLTKELLRQFPYSEILIATQEDQQIVHFRVFLLEAKREAFRSLGLDWPARVEQSFTVTPYRISSNPRFELALKALEGKGFVRLLSNPELVVRSPGKAELFAGGEIPIPHKKKQTLTWKPFGLKLTINLKETSFEHSRFEIKTEASSLDHQIGYEEIPGILANRMKTEVVAKLGYPLLLCGMIQKQVRRAISGFPLAYQIPILGTLFGSRDFIENQSELIAVILPHRIPPPNPMTWIDPHYPKGPAPSPRNWIPPHAYQKILSDPQYPWNVLE